MIQISQDSTQDDVDRYIIQSIVYAFARGNEALPMITKNIGFLAINMNKTYDDIFNIAKYIISSVAFKDSYDTENELYHIRLNILQCKTPSVLVSYLWENVVRLNFEAADELISIVDMV